ncbi:hypothetical protein [Acinetobacter tibetensis]|uniref:Uncharacterized protein n=1 Tax=Acinetobacter tibetensis TaxID=2943497 RepID=A0AAE9S0J4_9GAMM|nr:hypothetical protein [Acinetobacter tibetensis]USE83856.1 hypothetical protein M5E07_03175 [Acinetobacter tibetensis]
MLVERSIQYLYPEEYEALSEAFLPNVVLKLKLRGTNHYIDFGTILYLEHSKVDRRIHASPFVEDNSLISELIKPLHEYVLHMAKIYSHASLQHYFKIIRSITKDLYSNKIELGIYNKNKAFKIYQDYTQNLIMTRASKLKNSIADMGAYNRKQTVLAEILSRSLEVDIKLIKNSYIEIASKHKAHNQPKPEHDFQSFYKANESIFLILNLILTTNAISHLPISFSIQDLKTKLIIESFFKTPESHRDILKVIHKNKIKMINLACSAFVNCFASVTAINFSQILSLKIDDFKNLDSSTKGIRVITVKPRAGYKKIELSIPLKFKKLLNDFILFRNWVKDNLDLSNEENFLFFGLSNPLTIHKKNKLISYSENQHNLYRKWFKIKFQKIEWIPISNIRSTIANIYHNESKNIQVVAKKLGNTPHTVSTAYNEATEQQVLSEMTDTFQSIANSAPIIANKFKDIKLDLPNTLNTDMGHCSSKNPSLNTIYDNLDLEPPNCSNPISCLFCENFVVHSDEEDIHKLLSAKKVFEMASSAPNSENIYLVIQKINEILDFIITNNPEKHGVILSGRKLINKGILSPFFEIMLNTLTDLGIDFYD